MKIIANIGFAIALFVLSATIPFNIIKLAPNTMVMTFSLIGGATVLWIAAIRNLAYYKTFVHFRDESVPKTTGEIDTRLVADLYEKELKKLK